MAVFPWRSIPSITIPLYLVYQGRRREPDICHMDLLTLLPGNRRKTIEISEYMISLTVAVFPPRSIPSITDSSVFCLPRQEMTARYLSCGPSSLPAQNLYYEQLFFLRIQCDFKSRRNLVFCNSHLGPHCWQTFTKT